MLQRSTVPIYTTANDRIWLNLPKGQSNSSFVSSLAPMLVGPTWSHYGSQFYSAFIPSARPTLINVTSSQLNSSAASMFMNHASSNGNHFNPSFSSNSGQTLVNPI